MNPGAKMAALTGAYPANARATIPLPAGLGSERMTEATIAAMLALVDHAEQSPAVAAMALRIRDAARGSARPLPCVLFDALRATVRFRADPPGVERLRHPDQLIDEIGRNGHALGDCDELAVLAAALLEALGLSPALVVVKRRAGGPWEHVLAAYVPDATVPQPTAAQVVPVDPQEATRCGAWPDGIVQSRVFPIG